MQRQLGWMEKAEYLDSEGLSLSLALPLFGFMNLKVICPLLLLPVHIQGNRNCFFQFLFPCVRTGNSSKMQFYRFALISNVRIYMCFVHVRCCVKIN